MMWLFLCQKGGEIKNENQKTKRQTTSHPHKGKSQASHQTTQRSND